MATNPYANKVIYGNDTVMDISDTTATEGDVISGKTFYKANGAKATGTASFDVDWGDIGGNLQNQTDLYVALSKKSDFVGVERMIDDTVGWVGKNLADISKAEVGKNMGGNSNANHIRLGIPCESSKTYYFTISGTNSFSHIYYLRTATPPTGSPIVSTATAPQQITTRSTDKYIYLDFEKSSAATFADLENLKIMVYAEEYYLAEVWNGGVIYEEYHDNVDLTIDKKAELLDKATVGWVGKNKLEWKTASGTDHGVTFTVNSDKTITPSDTASGGNAVIYSDMPLKAGTYTLSGGISNDCPIQAYLAQSPWTTYGYDYGSGVTFTLESDITIRIQCIVMNGKSASGVFKPMLRDASITDSTFEPYHESVEDWYWENNATTGVHNFLPIQLVKTKPLNTQGTWSNNVYTANGMTFTFTEENGYARKVNLNGQANAGIDVKLGDYTLRKGTYRIKCGLYTNNFNTRFAITTASGSYVEFAYDKDGNDVFTLSEDTVVRPRLYIANGVSKSNVDLYPEITLAEDTYKEHTEYAMTNSELTEAVTERELWTGTVDIEDGQDHELTLSDDQTNFKYLRLFFKSSTNVHSVVDFPAEYYNTTRFGVTSNTVITNNNYIIPIRLTAQTDKNKIAVRAVNGTYQASSTFNVVKVVGIK